MTILITQLMIGINNITKFKIARYIKIYLAIICIIELILIFIQILDYKGCPIPDKITGTFKNSAPLAGFLGLSVPVFLSEYSSKDSHNKIFFKVLSIVCITIILYLQSRAAILALSISSFYIYNNKNHVTIKYKKITLMPLLLFVILIFIFCLYIFKPESAIGRLFIWKISMIAISHNPIKGYGYNYILGTYGLEQEKFFLINGGTEIEKKLADAPNTLYNEYLNIAMAWGIPTLIIISCFLFSLIYIGHKQKLYSLVSCLISLLIFAFFSYPMQYFVFVVTFFLLALAIITNKYTIYKKFITIVLTMLIIIYCYNISCRFYNIYCWEKKKEDPCYALMKLTWNKKAMFDCGIFYYHNKEYKKAKKFLRYGDMVSSDPMFLVLIGKTEWEEGNYINAEKSFIKAHNRVPNRMYPLYLLAKLYNVPKYRNKKKYRKMKNLILNMKVKVNSIAVMQMKDNLTNGELK